MVIDLKVLPSNPGVYLYKDRFDNIIYVGKAKNLKKRVSSYFNKTGHSIKTEVLVRNIKSVDYIIVDSEVEALLLENKLIKKHKPKYNINLKDDKTFAYIKITNDKIPKVVSSRRIRNDGIYFGPYTSGALRLEMIKILVRVFGLITSKTYSSKSFLNYEIGLAPARREDAINIEEYMKRVEEAKDFLSGKHKPVLRKLESEMKKASLNEEFELALEKKKQIEAILSLEDRQKVDLVKSYNQDVIVILNSGEEKALIQVFSIVRGVLSNKKLFRFDYYDDELLSSFIKMYYSKRSVPAEILVNIDFWESDEDKDSIEEYLKNFRGAKVSVVKPMRGEKVKLLELAIRNAKLSFGDGDVLVQMQNLIGLPRLPKVIECFDISNLSYDYIVGGMTRFVDGLEDKKGYRKFKIKSLKAGVQDDFGSMKEVVYRRYSRLKKEGGDMPDLIIIDGGKGQLRVAVEALGNAAVKIPIVSLAKRDEEVFVLGKREPINIDNNSDVMLFIRRVRDATHDYVISYNRKRRQMRLRDDVLK